MSRIDTLMARMTLSEKLGQLTMTASGYTVTGPVIAGDSTQSIIDGTIGNLLNMVGAGPVHEMQRIAVEESRLGIPLLIGLDIIHGHRTLFPSRSRRPRLHRDALGAHGARGRARDAADGLAMTFAPMLDISRDPRWGRTAKARAKTRGSPRDRARQGARLPGRRPVVGRIARRAAKHFVAYGAGHRGAGVRAVDISERTLREVHLPAFAAAVAPASRR